MQPAGCASKAKRTVIAHLSHLTRLLDVIRFRQEATKDSPSLQTLQLREQFGAEFQKLQIGHWQSGRTIRLFEQLLVLRWPSRRVPAFEGSQ